MTFDSQHRFFIVPAAIVSLILFFIGASVFADQRNTNFEEVKQETKEALEAIKKYSAEQRRETVKDVKAVIEELDANIERLESRIDRKWSEMDEAARKNATKTLKKIRKQRNELAEWYGGIRHSSAKAWEDVKSGFLKSYNSLQKSFKEAAKEF